MKISTYLVVADCLISGTIAHHGCSGIVPPRILEHIRDTTDDPQIKHSANLSLYHLDLIYAQRDPNQGGDGFLPGPDDDNFPDSASQKKTQR